MVPIIVYCGEGSGYCWQTVETDKVKQADMGAGRGLEKMSIYMRICAVVIIAYPAMLNN